MYRSEITETSIVNMSKIDLVAFKNLSDCIPMEQNIENSEDGYFTIKPVDYVKLHVENDQSENREYDVLIIVADNGDKYKTGSEAFERAFMDIFTELQHEDGWLLKIFGKESKNYKGKKFLTCSAVKA